MNAIEVDHLYYSYSHDGSVTPILNDLSLTIKTGELVAIQGPSGSGKSTLLYLLGLLAPADKGQIKILGKDLSKLSEEELAHKRNKSIGFVFQQFHLLPKTSVIENILLPTQYSVSSASVDENILKAEEYAKSVGLSDRLLHHPNQLSGGQQQRVAICRALMTNPEIILADEPTGNLDSVSAEQILNLLKKLNREMKKTIVIITHDNDVAEKCDRIIRIKDGRVADESSGFVAVAAAVAQVKEAIHETSLRKLNLKNIWSGIKESLPSALKNLSRNKARTSLTMLGISVGIAAVFAMITLGKFTKDKILAGYAEMGVNTILFYGYPNWEQRATDIVPAPFNAFEWEQEMLPLKKTFSEIQLMSPVLKGWDATVNFGGKSIDQDVRIYGSNEDALKISRRKLLFGRNFSHAEIEQRSGVCIVGYEIAQRLFSTMYPIGQVLKASQNNTFFGCRIIGVFAETSSNKEYIKPNLQVHLPFTYYQGAIADLWSSQIDTVMIQLNPGTDVEKTSKGLRSFFEKKYGKSGRFRVDSDSLLLAQMNRFLILFTVLLSFIAFVTLTVGGIGITNMMLVSVSERFREIGLRKALGATNQVVLTQFLVESIAVCAIAGFIGLVLGFAGYQSAIWATTKFIDKFKFEWVIDWFAFSLSVFSIFAVGLLSGIFPALKAEKLQVIEALRSE